LTTQGAATLSQTSDGEASIEECFACADACLSEEKVAELVC